MPKLKNTPVETVKTVKVYGGTITLSGKFNLFALTPRERELVRKIVELLDELETK